MTEKLKPMDVYACMTVPFDVAAYCRGHRFAPEAVKLARAIKARDDAERAAAAADAAVDKAREGVREAVEAARKRMDGDQHA